MSLFSRKGYDLSSVITNVRRKTRETFGEDLKEKYDDPAHEVVAHVIKTLTKKKVVTPGNYQSFAILTTYRFAFHN